MTPTLIDRLVAQAMVPATDTFGDAAMAELCGLADGDN
jgi:hypothetical protein